MIETTDLKLLENGVPFKWGALIEIHHIGRYHVVEYLHNSGKVGFHPYVDEKDTCVSYDTLEEAIIRAIQTKMKTWSF